MKVNKKYNCLFIGNAIIDVVSEVSFNFLEEQKIDIGSWRPVSVNEINELQEKMNNTIIASGGSAANSAVGFSLLGGSSAFIGRVKNDDFGSLYINDLKGEEVYIPKVMILKNKLTIQMRKYSLACPSNSVFLKSAMHVSYLFINQTNTK